MEPPELADDSSLPLPVTYYPAPLFRAIASSNLEANEQSLQQRLKGLYSEIITLSKANVETVRAVRRTGTLFRELKKFNRLVLDIRRYSVRHTGKIHWSFHSLINQLRYVFWLYMRIMKKSLIKVVVKHETELYIYPIPPVKKKKSMG